AVVEVDLVADVIAEPKVRPAELDAATGIEHAVGVTGRDAVHGGGEAAQRTAARDAEVQEPALHRSEHAERSDTGLDLRTEHSVQQTQPRSVERRRKTVAERGGDVALRVV